MLSGTRSDVTNERITAAFLPRLEVENYLLEPKAICAAVREELKLKGAEANVSVEEVSSQIQATLREENGNLFPRGKDPIADPSAQVKGSLVLQRIYERYALAYNKITSGTLIAKNISPRDQPCISELTELIRPLFPKYRSEPTSRAG